MPDTDRDRIVAAADRLFYSRGIQSVGMDDVRTEAGVSLRRLYAEFGSKDALLLAVLRHRVGIWDAGIAEAAAAAGAPRDKVLSVYDFLDDWFRTHDFRGCGFINAFGELGAVSPEVADFVRDQKDAFQAYLTDLVAEFHGSPGLAAQLALLAEGAQTTAAISGRPDAAGQARAAAEILIDAAIS